MSLEQSSSDDLQYLLECLAFQLGAGINEEIVETPRNRLQEAFVIPLNAIKSATLNQNAAPNHPKTKEQLRLETKAVGTKQAIEQAILQSKSAADLSALHQIIKQFQLCDLANTASNTVVGHIPSSDQPAHIYTNFPKIMVIQDCPGLEEDRHGIPFKGGEATLLSNMLARIDLSLSQIYASYMIFWRPPGNRSPTASEIAICKPFLERQIELIKPDLIVLLGKSTIFGLFQIEGTANALNGRWQDYSLANQDKTPDKIIPCLFTFSPSFLIKNPLAKALCWQSLLSLKAKLLEG